MTRVHGRRRGFTLIELMVVVSIVGILATLATPKVVEAMRRAKAAAILSDLNTIRGAALASFQQTNTYPSTNAWGVVPPELVAHLPQDFKFSGNGAQYCWQLWGTATGDAGAVNTGVSGSTDVAVIGLGVKSDDPLLLAQVASLAQGSIIPASDGLTYIIY
jgi:general secretion pathway protein G